MICESACPCVTGTRAHAQLFYDLNDDGLWLIADVTVRKGTQSYDRVLVSAWAAIILYPFGQLVMFALLLFKARTAIYNGHVTVLSRAIGFLHHEFAPAFFW